MSDRHYVLQQILKLIGTIIILTFFVWLLYSFVISPLLFQETKIIHVIDSDSMIVLENGTPKKIQLIGIDAPEILENGNAQCYSVEAKKYILDVYLKKNVKVKLTKDNALGDVDIYGRLLRYVTLDNGIILNEELIKKGLAKEFHLPDATYQYQKEFKKFEEEARRKDIGIWDPKGCKGSF